MFTNLAPRSRRRTLPILSSLVLSTILATYLYISRDAPLSSGPSVPEVTAPELETFASHAINDTVVVVPVNTGHLHWVDNLICSLEFTPFEASNIVFWTLDKHAQEVLQARGYATYFDSSLFATSANENHHGDTNNYKRMMRERPKFFIKFLSTGYNLLMIDADTVFWRSPLDMIYRGDLTQDVDFIFSTDAREFYQVHNAFLDPRRRGKYIPPICNGIFWVKSSSRTIDLYREMLAVFQGGWRTAWYRTHGFQDDQRGMDVLLNDGRAKLVAPLPEGITEDMVVMPLDGEESLNVVLLDQTLVVNGHLLLNRHNLLQDYLGKLRDRGGHRIAAHFNWNTKDESKEEGAEQLGLLFVDDKRRCRQHPPD